VKKSSFRFPAICSRLNDKAMKAQRRILKPRGEQIGVARLGWHTLCHTYRWLLDQTAAPIGVQQKPMRQGNVATTMNV
jgi:hypothetical protein